MESFYTDEQRMIRDAARDFATEQLAPNAALWDREAQLPVEVVRQMGELGFLGMIVPPEWGGSYTDYVAYALALEEIAAGCAACATMMSVHNSVGCGPILNFGTDAQKDAYLHDLATGRKIGAFCLTEPQGGSEANNLRTRADLAIVFAVTDPERGKRGLSAFMVPTDTPGLNVGKPEHKLGIRAGRVRRHTRLRKRAHLVRQITQGASEHCEHACRHDDAPECRVASRASRGALAHVGQAVPVGSLAGEALRVRNRRAGVFERDPDSWWLRLSGGLRSGAPLS